MFLWVYPTSINPLRDNHLVDLPQLLKSLSLIVVVDEEKDSRGKNHDLRDQIACRSQTIKSIGQFNIGEELVLQLVKVLGPCGVEFVH